jgi:hypothetical protein
MVIITYPPVTHYQYQYQPYWWQILLPILIVLFILFLIFGLPILLLILFIKLVVEALSD